MKRIIIILGLFFCLFFVYSNSMGVQSNRHMMTLDRYYYTNCDGEECCFKTYPEPESYFYASDEAAWLWFNWQGARPGDSYRMLSFAPGGALYDHLSSDSLIEREDGCLLLSFSINGSAPENIPGEWRIEVSVGGDYLFSQYFTISSGTRDASVAKKTMTLDPSMGGDCKTPPPNYIFYDYDNGAYFWFLFNAAAIGDEIIVEWYDPHGNLYMTESNPYNQGNGCWCPGISISGHSAEHLPGNWRVSLYYDGDKHFNEYFTIVDTSPDEPNPCPLSLIYGKDSLQTKALRSFRDKVLSNTPAGQELIKLYYQWSPTIVTAMEGDEEFKEEVKQMMDAVLPFIEVVVD